MNSFGWVDFSKKDRDLARDIIASLETPGALDELGIGVIRDGFADYFFPGTSTVQTIPKYFFLVAYQLEELSRNPSGNLEQRLREMERQCSRRMWDSLSSDEQNSGSTGVFGSTLFKDKDSSSKDWVKRQPSSVYWNGLRKLGFLSSTNDNLSLADYLRISKQRAKSSAESDDDLNAATKRFPNSSHPWRWKLPDDRDDWKSSPTTRLNLSEATFLAELITENLDDTLFAFLVCKRSLYPFGKMTFAEIGKNLQMPESLYRNWKLANDFSEFVKPAQIFFNYLLHNEEAETTWSEYRDNQEKLITLADSVKLDKVFELIKTPQHTKDFLIALHDNYLNLDEAGLKELLTSRERKLKGDARMKLGKEDSYHHYRDHWAGGLGFDYRFPDACRIIKDILIAEGKQP